jgi:hypothetical protein
VLDVHLLLTSIKMKGRTVGRWRGKSIQGALV